MYLDILLLYLILNTEWLVQKLSSEWMENSRNVYAVIHHCLLYVMTNENLVINVSLLKSYFLGGKNVCMRIP